MPKLLPVSASSTHDAAGSCSTLRLNREKSHAIVGGHLNENAPRMATVCTWLTSRLTVETERWRACGLRRA